MKKNLLKPFRLDEAGLTQSDLISKKQQKYILGGYDDHSGPCGWFLSEYALGYSAMCCISYEFAKFLFDTNGGYWCCYNDCDSTMYCGGLDCS